MAGRTLCATRAAAAAQQVGDRVPPRQHGEVRGGALQHGDVRGGLGHRGHQRHGGRAAADDHDAPAGVVEVVGPGLRVHEPAGEVLSPGKSGWWPPS